MFIPVVLRVTAEIEAMAGGAATELSRGGMRTKIEAAKMATTGGCAMLIANGVRLNPLAAVAGGARCTWFLTPSNPVTSRKKWIAGALEPRGALHLDVGAVRALRAGKSLLPAGSPRRRRVRRGETVAIRGSTTGDEIGRGLVAYDAEDLRPDPRLAIVRTSRRRSAIRPRRGSHPPRRLVIAVIV